MIETANLAGAPPGIDAIQREWEDLKAKIRQLEAERATWEAENKTLRQQVEKLIAHRQASHSELVLLLTTLVSKLPINDVGVIVSRLVEHNTNVSQYLSALAKGTAETPVEQPELLKTLDHTKRDLQAAIKPLVQELIALNSPLETGVLEGLGQASDEFFTPQTIRATRCFLKGQVPRERILRQYGPEAILFFNDLTTDPKLNPRPKPDEIVLAFKAEFETLLAQHPAALGEKRLQLLDLYQRVQQSKSSSENARLQKSVFQRLSFIIELLHYYQHQSTENPEVIFAHRLPALIEQLVLGGPQDTLDEKLIREADALLAHVINPDHRQMIINNMGKTGGIAKTLKLVLKLRAEKVPEMDTVIAEFIRHLITPPPAATPRPAELSAIIKLLHPAMQRFVTRTLLTTDRLRRDQAETLAKAIALELGIKDVERHAAVVSPEIERELAWAKIKDMVLRRADAATVADAIRERLHAKYDADEIRQSWIVLTQADPMSLIRVFCSLPYGGNGKTDAIARPVMETYVSRLTHEKYAPTYRRIVRSLHNMFVAKPDSPTLLNFTTLVRWVDPAAANKLCADIGMAAPA